MTTYMLKDRCDPSPKPLGKLVYTSKSAGFPVYLFNQGNRYAVQYGLQLDYELTYTEACSKLGEAILHALMSNGELD